MNKRIRKKMAKRAAENGAAQTPSAALHDAVEALKDSATHLFETALSELAQSASALVAELRAKALGLMAYLKQNAASVARPAQISRRRAQHTAT